MSRDLFPGIKELQVKALEGGNLQIGVDMGRGWFWHDLTEQQVIDAVDSLLDLADEAWPMDPDDDLVTPNLVYPNLPS